MRPVFIAISQTPGACSTAHRSSSCPTADLSNIRLSQWSGLFDPWAVEHAPEPGYSAPLTNLEARYSTPRATWYPNDTRSLYVSSGWLVMPDAAIVETETGGCLYSVLLFDGRRSRRKSRRLPCAANSTITYRGPVQTTTTSSSQHLCPVTLAALLLILLSHLPQFYTNNCSITTCATGYCHVIISHS